MATEQCERCQAKLIMPGEKERGTCYFCNIREQKSPAPKPQAPRVIRMEL